MRPRSSPAKIAAVPRNSPAEQPAVTSPASAPVCRAMCREAAACHSSSEAAWAAASAIACRTASGIKAPPRRVTEPVALITGTTPNRS
ncbi:MAG: hypothetical protein ACKOGA_10200 [Planctomycetaceae bacterium]